MTLALKLTHDEPRLVYLALVYHLGRPGSELDPVTKTPRAHGLRDVKVRLGRDLQADEAVIELDEENYRRLLSAIYGSVTEMRVYHMRNGERSTVERFTETAESLFPEIKEDPAEALTVAEALMMLHRRMERAVSRARAATPEPGPGGAQAEGGQRRWRLWRR
ncbi:MAG TPA: hypothetical protein VNM91_12030 [Dehalococcoidia bacterium]|nr:hypothetical protein [Dehalococcoidia bacterium]